MASSLRKRLGRRTALTDMKTNNVDGGDSSGASSSESSLKAPTTDAKKPTQGLQAISPSDLSTTPPPDRKLRSSKDFSRDRTPPQSLLEKYKGKAAKQALPTASATNAKKAASTETVARSDSKGEGQISTGKEHSLSPRPSTHPLETLSSSKGPAKSGETHRVNGVEFDMLSQAKPNADVIRHGPTQGEKQQTQHRRTRSKARREERERASPMDDGLSDELKLLHMDSGLEPPLSIRKVDRTPSPRVERESEGAKTGQARDGLWESARKLEKEPPRLPARAHTRSPALVDQAVADVIPAPPPRSRILLPPPTIATAANHPTTGSSSRSPSSSPAHSDTSIRTPPNQKRSILKNTHSPDSSALSMTINPPVVLPNNSSLSPAAKGYIFCSERHGTSMPVEPWAWCKRWTCCACLAEDDDLRGVDGGWEKPASTMAEQKICSRLSCGHVRCSGCWMEREPRFGISGPFGR